AASGVVTRRRRRKAEDYIVSAKATPTQLATDLTLLNALRYAPEGTVVLEAMPASSSPLGVDRQIRNLGLSGMDARTVRRLVQERQAAITPQTTRRLAKLTQAARRTV
ncbi:MAG TPA: hypothetical protein VD735_05825, partial [Candidatus Saccharimonadales bacterium]|nr:hypothetical protein [Candidatus Saccharimonadales bacterium]